MVFTPSSCYACVIHSQRGGLTTTAWAHAYFILDIYALYLYLYITLLTWSGKRNRLGLLLTLVEGKVKNLQIYFHSFTKLYGASVTYINSSSMILFDDKVHIMVFHVPYLQES